MSEARTGQKPWNSGKAGVYSAETRRKMGAKNVGKILSAEHKRSISAGLNSHYSAADGPNKGKTFSTEHKNKISNSLKAYRAKIENISHDTIQTEPDHVEDISKLKE